MAIVRLAKCHRATAANRRCTVPTRLRRVCRARCKTAVGRVGQAVLTATERPRAHRTHACTHAASDRQFDSLMSRPLTDWIGGAFIGYRRAKMPIWSFDIGIGVFITIHSTPSLQGGVVSDPM